MSHDIRLKLDVIERRVCDVASEQMGIERDEIRPSSRFVEDLHCDSLDAIEFIMELEDEFDVTIPNDPVNPVGKSIFARQPFRLKDIAEIVYLQQGSGTPDRKGWRRKAVTDDAFSEVFSQLDGRWQSGRSDQKQFSLLELLGTENGIRQFRRRSDGMRCVLIPSVETKIGNDGPESQPDERPAHTVKLDSFVIDMEPVSTTAYCRFLNSVEATEARLLDWFVLEATDDRIDQMPIVWSEGEWCPVVGAETIPMVLVSWYGANAYSLWANGSTWEHYDSLEGFLPSEAQWEHAAQGAFDDTKPDELKDAQLVYGQHERGACYNASTMPMSPVHSPIGVSSFGLHHMAGNVWQWCRDWYAADFYKHPESFETNPRQ